MSTPPRPLELALVGNVAHYLAPQLLIDPPVPRGGVCEKRLGVLMMALLGVCVSAVAHLNV